ncbi:MAG TPA: BON domain-containing protein [Thermoanaerobaculia bacterium]|jgi:osmotically-inducible protein OsmY|nr:BON domain-containing protein [Thermoanaerobaculia bacterium]
MRAPRQLIAAGILASAATLALTGCVASVVDTRHDPKDDRITTAVMSRLAANPELAAINFNVDTFEGAVTISGRVATDEERQAALDVARATEGAKQVVDNLNVEDHDPN